MEHWACGRKDERVHPDTGTEVAASPFPCVAGWGDAMGAWRAHCVGRMRDRFAPGDARIVAYCPVGGSPSVRRLPVLAYPLECLT